MAYKPLLDAYSPSSPIIAVLKHLTVLAHPLYGKGKFSGLFSISQPEAKRD